MGGYCGYVMRNVSGLGQTVRFLPNKVELFYLNAPSSLAGEPGTRKRFDMRMGSTIKSQAEIHTAARRDSSEDFMKRLLTLIVVTAVLGALGFAQIPAASPATDPPTAAAPAPAATATTPAEPVVAPVVPATPPVQTAVPPVAPAATVSMPAEPVVAPVVPATPPVQTAVPPVAPAATVSTPAEPVVAPAAAATHAPRLAASPRKLSATHTAATTTAPPVTANSSSEPVSTPAAAAATSPAATATGWSSWLFIPFAMAVIVIGVLATFLSRWRKRRLVEQTSEQNLSFSNEVSSDQDERDKPVVAPKAA
jgi:hypothetical protein